jgi:hypothetical protein
MTEYVFWIHGVNVQVEYTDPTRGVSIRRRGDLGAEIRQNDGTSNWFHFAIPTPTLLDLEEVLITKAYLRVLPHPGNYIRRVHIRHGGVTSWVHTESAPSTSEYLYRNDDLDIHWPIDTIDHEFDIRPNRQVTAPVVMCVHVDFQRRSTDRIYPLIFHGAGARFSKRAEGIERLERQK